MLTELESALDGVSSPFTSADRADRVYEAYIFSQVVAAAAEAGATVSYENAFEQPVKDLVFRGSPGVLHSQDRRFTHALICFGSARPVEAHIRVKVRGTNMEAESDILLLDTKSSRESRRKDQLPRPPGCLLSIECKYYLVPLPRDEALQYMGVRLAMPTLPSLFATNSFSVTANRCLSDSKQPYEFDVMPGTSNQNHLRSHIRNAFKRFVTRFDYGHRI